LALGIGANIAIFSLIYSAMLRSLPVPHPEELVSLRADFGERPSGDQQDQGPSAYQRNGMYKALSPQHALAGLCGVLGTGITDSSAEETVRVNGEAVTGDCFTTLGVKPLLGRLIMPSDDTPNPGPQGFPAVISYAWWNARYHRDQGVIGKQFTVKGAFSRQEPIVIVGVLPPEFHGVTTGVDPRIYLPSYFSGAENRDANTNISMLLFGRLRQGQTLIRTEDELQPEFQDWLRRLKATGELKDISHVRLVVMPDAAGYSSLALEYGKGLRLLQVLVAIILVAACFYLSTLFSARAVARRREFAVRAALGASRARLLSQSLIESAILVGAGAVSGLLIAWTSARYLVYFLANGSPELYLDVRPQGWVLAFAGGVAALALFLTGLLPAWRATKANVIADIKESRSGALIGVRNRFGSVLFPLQVALSLIVIVVASLLSSSLLRALTQDNGFKLNGSVFVRTDVSMVLPEEDKDGKKLQSTLAMYDDVLSQMNHTPGIRSASADVTHPLGGAFYAPAASSKYRQMPKGEVDSYLMDWVAPRYFETAGTPLLAGRDFDERDNHEAEPACILSESAARYFFPNMSPIGQVMTEPWKTGRSYTVVGVVRDTRFKGMETNPPMMLYLPINQTQGFMNSVEFFLRTDDINTSVAILRRILHDRAGAHVMEVIPVSDEVKESLSRTRLLTVLSNTFAGLALLLSAVGIFGLLNYSVSRRTTEIGVRMALGASRGQVVAMTLRQAAWLILPGIGIGLIAAWAASRLVASLLYQTKPFDPAAFAVSVAALAIVVGLGSYLPARRAAMIEPMEALRAE
jgi:predicted permease